MTQIINRSFNRATAFERQVSDATETALKPKGVAVVNQYINKCAMFASQHEVVTTIPLRGSKSYRNPRGRVAALLKRYAKPEIYKDIKSAAGPMKSLYYRWLNEITTANKIGRSPILEISLSQIMFIRKKVAEPQ